MERVGFVDLKRLCKSILIAAGAEDDIASLVSESLVEAEMCGVHSHGIIRLRPYIESIRNKNLIPNAKPEVVKDNRTVVILDGNRGFGQFVASVAMGLAVERAKLYGLACVGARNLHHSGMLEFITHKASSADMIGIAFNNTEPLMVPPGGNTKVVGNNPFSISVPSNSHPVALDMAQSVVARGKIREALFEGRNIEPNWAVDRDGNPTTDPSEAMEGALLPVGAHKGFGMAFIIDILAGVLTGSETGSDVITWEAQPDSRWQSGLVTIAINPSYFLDIDVFKGKISETVTKAKKAQRDRKIFVPGEDRRESYLEALKNGVPISDKSKNELKGLSNELGIDTSYIFRN